MQCCMYHVCVFVGDEDVDEQLYLRDDTIFQLKQQMSTMQQRIEELNYENEELRSERSLTSFKGKGTMYIAHAPLFTDVCVFGCRR